MNAHILIVDDDPRNRRLLEAMLRAEGCTTTSVASGQAVPAAVQANRPALILLDLMMPDMDGFEVMRRLKDDPAAQGVPVVLITALDDAAARARAVVAGAAGILGKPVDRWALKASLVRLAGSGDERS